MENGYTERAKAGLRLAALYVRSIGKWLVLAVAVGLVCGVIGTAFHMGVHEATLLRGEHPWLLWCLPLAFRFAISACTRSHSALSMIPGWLSVT